MQTVKIKKPAYEEYRVGGNKEAFTHAVVSTFGETNKVIALAPSEEMARLYRNAWVDHLNKCRVRVCEEDFEIFEVFQEK